MPAINRASIINNEEKAIQIATDIANEESARQSTLESKTAEIVASGNGEHAVDKVGEVPIIRMYRGVAVRGRDGEYSFVIGDTVYTTQDEGGINAAIDNLTGGCSETNDAKTIIDELDVNQKWKNHFLYLARIEAAKRSGDKKKTKSVGIGFLNTLGILIFGPIQYFILGMWKKGTIAIGILSLSVASLYYILAMVGVDSKAVGFLWYGFLGIIPRDYYDHKVNKTDIWGCFSSVSNPALIIAASISCVILSGYTMSMVSTPDDLMEEVSGVWRDDDNHIYEIRLGGAVKKIIYDGKTFIITPKRGGNMDGIVVMDVADQPRPWTIRQVMDKSGRFTLTLTVNDKDTISLGYLRP